jgi:hypothetical protein
MTLVRFGLEDVGAFKNKTQQVDAGHFCMSCAREASGNGALFPMLNGQVEAALSDFAQGLGAMISCDKCGQVIATHYPETFWADDKEEEPKGHRSPILFKKF